MPLYTTIDISLTLLRPASLLRVLGELPRRRVSPMPSCATTGVGFD